MCLHIYTTRPSHIHSPLLLSSARQRNKAGKEHLAHGMRLEMCDCVKQPLAVVAGPVHRVFDWCEMRNTLRCNRDAASGARRR